MTTTTDLTAIAREAGEHVTDETWMQGAMDGPGGAHCAHGWVRACAPTPGDEHLVRAAMRHRGMDEEWNDNAGQTAPIVAAALFGLDVDAALVDLWGPAAPAVVRVVRQAGSMTEDQVNRLNAARDAAWDAAWDAAGEVSAGAARGLVAAPLVGRRGLTQEHVDTLLAPWITVMGDPR